MNEIEMAISFLMICFVGSLLFANKKKQNSATSFFINLEMEYIFIGLIIFFVGGGFSIPGLKTMHPYLALIMSFMGLLIGSQFSITLLKNVSSRLFIVLFIVYVSTHIVLYIIFRICNIETPYLAAIMINTAMPYSVQLYCKLFRVPMKRFFYIMLSASLYPAMSISHYGIYIGFKHFTIPNMILGGLIALVFALLVSSYAQLNNRKGINSVSIIMLIILTGLSEYYKLSPLMIGFMTGLFLANFHYSDVFINIYGSFDRFFYLFCYVFIGIFLMWEIPGSGTVYLSIFLSVIMIIIVRSVLMKYIFNKLMPVKESFINIISIGILPAVLIMDYGLIIGLGKISIFLWVFILIHILTEIMEYNLMRNETKNS